MSKERLKTAADWYDVESIHASIKRQLKCGSITRIVEGIPMPPPSDVGSLEFAEWFARHLRLAMAKGIDLAKREKPRYRPPQPSDDGRWCFLEELPSDAPPTLVRLNGEWVPTAGGHSWTHSWQYWTVAGWRELTGNVWPCERPE